VVRGSQGDRVHELLPGCNVTATFVQDQVKRLQPGHNSEVNGHWMCDQGRLEIGWVHSADRLGAKDVKGYDRGARGGPARGGAQGRDRRVGPEPRSKICTCCASSPRGSAPRCTSPTARSGSGGCRRAGSRSKPTRRRTAPAPNACSVRRCRPSTTSCGRRRPTRRRRLWS
jgi:hypothetical protein